MTHRDETTPRPETPGPRPAFSLPLSLAAALLAASATAMPTFPSAALAEAADACGETSLAALRACKPRATGDYWIAVANCENLLGAAESKACEKQARADQRSSIAGCEGQFNARQNLCALIGEDAYDPDIDPADFPHSTTINNPYFPLVPGTKFDYVKKDANGNPLPETGTFEVTHDTISILGVTCIVVRDRAFVDSSVAEDTLDYFAQDEDGNVWYFGELSKDFENGFVVSFAGSWQAGVDGAKAGIVMLTQPHAGETYRQEFALDEAEDAATVLSLTEAVTVPYGTFANVLETHDFTPLEPSANEQKFFAPGVGQVLTIDVVTGNRTELVAKTVP